MMLMSMCPSSARTDVFITNAPLILEGTIVPANEGCIIHVSLKLPVIHRILPVLFLILGISVLSIAESLPEIWRQTPRLIGTAFIFGPITFSWVYFWIGKHRAVDGLLRMTKGILQSK